MQALKEAHEALTATHAELVASSSTHAETLAEVQAKLDDAIAKHAQALSGADEAAAAKITQLEDALRQAEDAAAKLKEEHRGRTDKLVEEERARSEVDREKLQVRLCGTRMRMSSALTCRPNWTRSIRR